VGRVFDHLLYRLFDLPDNFRWQILHMLRRERGVMPHFRDTVGDAQVREIVAYLRTIPR
jgi:mono/diheme cytochrome c family protein